VHNRAEHEKRDRGRDGQEEETAKRRRKETGDWRLEVAKHSSIADKIDRPRERDWERLITRKRVKKER
jgi:hypothetical protein